MYKSEVKCTLMANDPQANIELLFQSCSHQKDGDAGSDIQKPCMRMRLSRQNHSLEIARHISGARGGEWTKKTLVATREPRVVGEAEWKELDVTEKDGLKCLSEFLEVSEAVELLEKGGSARRPLPPIVTPSVIGFRHAPSDKQYPIGDEILPSSSAPPIQKTLPTVNITSRPPKLDPATGKHGACNNLPRVVNESTGTGRQRLGRSFQSGTVQWRQEEHSISAAIQTRFVPSVGWCIRYGSSVSQGGRYRMLFLDGVIVDVDVDEEWVEFRSGEGDVTR
jgi:polo-like kinase 4